MKLNSLGFSFKYHGDEVLWYWPWVRKGVTTGSYHSQMYSRDFNSFNEYWKINGEEAALIKASVSKGKVAGFSLDETLAGWSARMYLNEYVIILTSINVAAKGPSFWARLTTNQRSNLMSDVVVLRCKDKTEMYELLDSISHEFAEASAFINGVMIGSNDDTKDYS